MTALILGTLLALAAVSYVLYPLLVSRGPSAAPPVPDEPGRARENVRSQAIEALTEIEFDRATGKLSGTDYESLKASYTEQVQAAMLGGDTLVCAQCGARPESDARFCSRCGRPV